jgi:hypothetical protein
MANIEERCIMRIWGSSRLINSDLPNVLMRSNERIFLWIYVTIINWNNCDEEASGSWYHFSDRNLEFFLFVCYHSLWIRGLEAQYVICPTQKSATSASGHFLGRMYKYLSNVLDTVEFCTKMTTKLIIQNII